MMSNMIKLAVSAFVVLGAFAGAAHAQDIGCGTNYSVKRGDTLSRISLRSYGSTLYQPIYNANVETIGTNPDRIFVGQSLLIPCLSSGSDQAASDDQLVFTFNKASAPPFIINSGIIDAYLSEIVKVTDGRVTFVDPEVINRDHTQQYELVTSGQVDGAYVLNSTIADQYPLLQLPMLPMLGGSAEQTAVSLWRLHDEYLSATNYFSEAQLLGFVASPAAHIWRDNSLPVTAGENVATKNDYSIPYFSGLDTRGPAAMREEFAQRASTERNEPPAYFMAHGAALAVGLWTEDGTVSVMEVDNGLYTPTFSVVLSNDAWAQISAEDQQAILAVSGEALAFRSAAWDDFDNAFRSRMLDLGLEFQKAEKELLDDLWISSFAELNAWIKEMEERGISGTEALNSYLADLRSLEDRLVYRGEETFVDQHPFVTGGF